MGGDGWGRGGGGEEGAGGLAENNVSVSDDFTTINDIRDSATDRHLSSHQALGVGIVKRLIPAEQICH